MKTKTSKRMAAPALQRRLRALSVAWCFMLTTSALAQVPLPERGALHGNGIILLSQEVVVSAEPIDVVSVSGTTVSLNIQGSGAGSNPEDATDNSTSYSITTNGASRKLTGALDQAYGGGVTLAVTLAAPAGGTSAGEIILSTVSQTLVTGITRVTGSSLSIAYRASVPPGAPPNGGETNTVTITLTDL